MCSRTSMELEMPLVQAPFAYRLKRVFWVMLVTATSPFPHHTLLQEIHHETWRAQKISPSELRKGQRESLRKPRKRRICPITQRKSLNIHRFCPRQRLHRRMVKARLRRETGPCAIGHGKAIAVNFGFTKYHNGVCFLRYDDTNPAKEGGIFFTSIREIIAWLGFEPYKITCSSDNFDWLYELAEELIKLDKAYVRHYLRESCQNFHILDRPLINLQEKKLTSNVAGLTTEALTTLVHIENDMSKNPWRNSEPCGMVNIRLRRLTFTWSRVWQIPTKAILKYRICPLWSSALRFSSSTPLRHPS